MVPFVFAENKKVAGEFVVIATGEFVSAVTGPVDTIAPVTEFTVNPSIACGSATKTKDCGEVCAYTTHDRVRKHIATIRVALMRLTRIPCATLIVWCNYLEQGKAWTNASRTNHSAGLSHSSGWSAKYFFTTAISWSGLLSVVRHTFPSRPKASA